MLHSLLIKVSFSCKRNIYDASHKKSTKIATHAGNDTTRHKKNYLPTFEVIRVVWVGACAFVFCVGPSSDMFLLNDLYMRKMPTKWLYSPNDVHAKNEENDLQICGDQLTWNGSHPQL